MYLLSTHLAELIKNALSQTFGFASFAFCEEKLFHGMNITRKDILSNENKFLKLHFVLFLIHHFTQNFLCLFCSFKRRHMDHTLLACIGTKKMQCSCFGPLVRFFLNTFKFIQEYVSTCEPFAQI